MNGILNNTVALLDFLKHHPPAGAMLLCDILRNQLVYDRPTAVVFERGVPKVGDHAEVDAHNQPHAEVSFLGTKRISIVGSASIPMKKLLQLESRVNAEMSILLGALPQTRSPFTTEILNTINESFKPRKKKAKK